MASSEVSRSVKGAQKALDTIQKIAGVSRKSKGVQTAIVKRLSAQPIAVVQGLQEVLGAMQAAAAEAKREEDLMSPSKGKQPQVGRREAAVVRPVSLCHRDAL